MLRKLIRQLDLFFNPGHDKGGALRSVVLSGRPVSYRFERRRRRTLGAMVDERGLRVVAPLRLPLREVEAFLHSKARWITAKLQLWAARGKPRSLSGRSGESFPVFGREVTLLVLQGPAKVTLTEDMLTLQLRKPEKALDALKSWLRAQALQQAAKRAAHYAAQLGLPPPPVALSNARTRWGTCSARGRLRISWRLAHLAPELADYVVAHEVAHLKEMNHSRRFWSVLETLYPDCRSARQRIRRAAATLPQL